MNFETNIAEGIFTETESPELNHTELNHTEFNELEAMSPFMNSDTETGFYSEISFSEYEAGKNNWSKAVSQNNYYGKSLGWDKESEKIRNYLKQYLGLTSVSFTDDIFAKSVYEWQSRIKAGLTADGVIGPRSWAVLKTLLAGAPVSPPAQTVFTPSRWTSIIKDTVLCPAEPLLHGGDAYKKIAEAIRTADSSSHYIYILGWMLDDSFEMVPGDPGSTLYNLLSRANEKGVEIRILIWNNFFYKDEITAAINKINKLPNALMIRDNYTYGSAGLKNAISKIRYLINSAPIALNLLDSWKDFKEKVNIIQNEGSHHEKVVVVKGREGLIAFCGGIDINPDRVWKIENGKSAVLHDVHCMVKGYAAYVLLHRFKWRWQVLRESLYWMPLLKNCINEPVPGAISGSGSAHVKILQTYNHPSKIIKDRTIRETVRIAIANARTSIHFEDQYMISLEIASWVNAKLKEPGFQRVTILTQDDSYAKPDIQFPKDMRKKFIDYLCRGLTPDQIRTKVFIQMLHPDSPPLSHHKVHSKIYIIDDELAIIGSANCSSRSMTHDSETAAVIFSDPGTDNFVSKLRSKMNYDPLQNIIPYYANPKVIDKDVELTDDINNFASKASIITGMLTPALPVSQILNSLIPALKPAFIDIIDPDADGTVPQQELNEEYELNADHATNNSFEFHDSGLNKSLSETEYYENTDQFETGDTKDQESYEYAKYEDINNNLTEIETASETISNGAADEFSLEYEENKWAHAVSRNRYHAKALGWDRYINEINDFLLPFSGLKNVSLGEEIFAQSVAEWQRRQGFSLRDADGIIGPKTWQIMRTHIPGARAQQTGTNQNIKTGSSGMPAWVNKLTPLLNKHRGDIPLEFLLGWIAVESYGKIDVTTSLNERGYFQIHPDESKMLKIADHNRLSTDPEFSITSGISLIRNRGIQAGKIADSLGFAKGSDLYWHIVKLLHWLPGGVKIIMDEMISQGFKPTEWEEFKNFVIRNQDKIKQTMRIRFGKVWDPLKGLANVDKLYNYSNQFKQNLQTNELEDQYEIQPDVNLYDIPYFKNLKPDGEFKARRLIENITDAITGKKPWSFLFELMKFALTEYFNALQFGEQISCLKGISYAIVARTIGEIPPQPSRNWPLSQQKAYIDGAAFVGNIMKKGMNISPYDGIKAATKETDVNIVFGLLGAQLYKSKAGSPWYMIRSITGSLKWPKDNILLYELEEYKENVSEYEEGKVYGEFNEYEEEGINRTYDEMNYENSYSADKIPSAESYETIYEESENHTETIDEPDYGVKEDGNEYYNFTEEESSDEVNYGNISGSKIPRGNDIYETGIKHTGEKYVFGAVVPKNDSGWKGPWDCAEFASWCVYQVSGKLYGCEHNDGNPSTENAYTGHWGRDAKNLGKIISIEEAARTKGAAVLRLSTPSSATGHIVISDGKGGTVEAHSSSTGVIKSTLSNRRWDMGILVPGIQYEQGSSPVPITNPTSTIYRLTNPMMRGEAIKDIQIKLKAKGFDPGAPDGVYGLKTYNAVRAFQMSAGLVVDGEAGPEVIKALSQNTGAPIQPSVPVYTPGGASAPSVQNISEFNKWHAQKILENMNSGVIGQYFDSKSQLEKLARGETVLNVNPQSRIVQILPLIWHISEQAKINNYREIMIGSFIRDKSSDGSCTGHCEGRCIDINYKGGSFESSGSVTMVINILKYLVSLTALYKKSMGFGMPLQGEFFGNTSLAKFKSQPASLLINNDLKQLVPQLGYVFPDNNNHLHIQVKWL